MSDPPPFCASLYPYVPGGGIDQGGRCIGRQAIEVDGKTVLIDALTSFESPLGRSRCYTRASETAPVPGALEQRVREAAAQALAAQGIW